MMLPFIKIFINIIFTFYFLGFDFFLSNFFSRSINFSYMLYILFFLLLLFVIFTNRILLLFGIFPNGILNVLYSYYLVHYLGLAILIQLNYYSNLF